MLKANDNLQKDSKLFLFHQFDICLQFAAGVFEL